MAGSVSPKPASIWLDRKSFQRIAGNLQKLPRSLSYRPYTNRTGAIRGFLRTRIVGNPVNKEGSGSLNGPTNFLFTARPTRVGRRSSTHTGRGWGPTSSGLQLG